MSTPTPTAIAGLIHYNTARSDQKKQAVLDALAELLEHPQACINKSTVARHAGVSREFIYAHPNLRRLVDTAATELRNHPEPASSEHSSINGLRAQNQTFATKISEQKTVITQLRATIEELQRQRQHYLGSALVHSVVDVGDHQRLQADMIVLLTRSRHYGSAHSNKATSSPNCARTSPHPGAHTEDNERNTLSNATVSLHGKK
ncbi:MULTISPECIES: DUF6262 family protein [Rhodococcus]|uniref:DUF6262 family protein n=1 Tax=Rhodococcus TaxID=1827 RepID=UPI000ABC506A|nr:DUF6262 family protein [Rhodococcus opacus]UZG57252.1 DUF6262 family protein [Rhodococcus opacus]